MTRRIRASSDRECRCADRTVCTNVCLRKREGDGAGRKRGRENDSKSFEDALLAQFGGDSSEDEEAGKDDARAAKRRRMEEELLKGL